MSHDFTSQRIEDMDAAFSGAFKRAAAELGVDSFGLSVIDLPPDFDAYPEHDHLGDGQEEVYVALRGSGDVEIDGDTRLTLDADTMVRVGPVHRRRLLPGPAGLRVLTVGAVPGHPYRRPPFFELTAPDSASRAGPPPQEEQA